ncbi:hypothetical protein [Hymenobacter bucti]|uniref:Uncharacterized protein n=1 Tax=Hymenobacter bucti TaxID=1844114 RepID=A0ABW4R107_9BACT
MADDSRSSLLAQLVARIAALQSIGDQYHPAGLFPSLRWKKALGYRRPDSNGFFTSLIVFTLREIRAQLPAASQAVVDDIAAKALAVYPLYQSKSGQATYNFYPPRPKQHFPHGYLLHRTRHFAAPDDLDSTSLVYLSNPRSEPENRWLKAKLQAHANTVKGWADTGPRAFRGKKIYSAWFGERMPIDLDASTLSNGMLWAVRTGLPLNEFDADSLAFINWTITSGEYRRRPLAVSAYYATAPLIAYHVGRLLAEADLPPLAEARATLRRDLPALLATASSFMNKILLATTLLRLGEQPAPLLDPAWTLADLEPRSRGLYFCIAPLLNYYPHTRWLARWRLSQIDWECPAHSLALLAEYVALGGQ